MRKLPAFNFQLSILILLFSFFSSFSVLARDLSPNEEKALDYLRELCFEVTRYSLTDVATRPECSKLAEVSRFGTRLFSQRKILIPEMKSVYFCEFFDSERLGIIDCTFCPEDVYVSSDEPYFDWIDLVLASAGAQANPKNSNNSTDVTDGRKILEMLENNDSRGIEAQNENKDSDSLPQEASYTKKDGSLRRFSYDGEQLTVTKEDDDTVIVNYYGQKFIRKRFDSFYRLIRNERFKTGRKAKDLVLEDVIVYEYSPDSYIPEKTIEEIFSEKKRLESLYDSNGKLLLLTESHYDEDNELRTDKKTARRYDIQGRTEEEEVRLWNYKKNTFGKLSVDEHVMKTVYDYEALQGGNHSEPDIHYYEDGELHLERKHTSPESYSEKLFFEGGFSVEVLYENGIKKTEIIYLNNVEQRRRNFEY